MSAHLDRPDALELEFGRRWRAERVRSLLAELWGDGLPGGDDPLGTLLVDAVAADDLHGVQDDLVVQSDGLRLSALARILEVFPPDLRRDLVPAELLRRLPPARSGWGEGAWEWRIDSDTFAFDEACARLLHLGEHAGLTPARELLELSIDPADHVAIEVGLRATATTGQPYRMDFRLLDGSDGPQEWLTAMGRLIDFPTDEPARVIGFVAPRLNAPVPVA